MALRESGITQTVPSPTSLNNLSGLAAKFKSWIQQSWEDVKIENDQTDIIRAWFYTTVNPRFFFDLNTTGLSQTFPGDTLIGQQSGCTFTVTNVIVTNGGIWADGTAQGFIEFTNAVGSPGESETLLINATQLPSCRYLRWGDYQLDSQLEMGTGYIADLEDVWMESLKISDVASYNSPLQERELQFVDYSTFLNRYDIRMLTTGTPWLVTRTPDFGARLFFHPAPDRPYRIGGWYNKIIPGLVNDTDVPIGLKPLYHPMIAWRAVMYYGQYEQQQSIVAEASQRYTVFKKKLDRMSELDVTLCPTRLY